jgi:hypothetical protein
MTPLRPFVVRNRVILASYGLALLMLVVVSLFRPGFGSIEHLRTLAVDASIIGLASWRSARPSSS